MLPVGLEPTTLALLAPCSTDWAMRALGEKEEKESIKHFQVKIEEEQKVEENQEKADQKEDEKPSDKND